MKSIAAGPLRVSTSAKQKRGRGRGSQPRPRPRLNSQPQGATESGRRRLNINMSGSQGCPKRLHEWMPNLVQHRALCLLQRRPCACAILNSMFLGLKHRPHLTHESTCRHKHQGASGGIKRDKLKGTNGAKLAVFRRFLCRFC